MANMIDLEFIRKWVKISEEELMENGLEVDDFLQNDGRTEVGAEVHPRRIQRAGGHRRRVHRAGNR